MVKIVHNYPSTFTLLHTDIPNFVTKNAKIKKYVKYKNLKKVVHVIEKSK